MKTKLVIIGGGTGGIMVAARLKKLNINFEITLLDPAEYHWYQPAWTLVGAGTFDMNKTKRPMSELIPKGVTWVRDHAIGIVPESNQVKTSNSSDINYDILVLSPGLVNDFSLIEGLDTAIDKGVVCSNYTNPEHTWDVLRNFKGGRAIFTQPTTPIKCGGAPQKIAYLAADYFRKNHLSSKTKVTFATPGTVIFGLKNVADTLMSVIKRYDMEFIPYFTPTKIDGSKNTITFKNTNSEENNCILNMGEMPVKIQAGEDITIPFDMLHLAPPQAAPKFLRNSSLAASNGWLDVDKYTLQHNKFPNIFGLGDVANLPTAKTGAAIRKQVPVVVDNIIKLVNSGKIGILQYDGYSSCPLVTAYGKMVLAEFNYKNEFVPDPKLKQMLVFDSDKEHWRLWMLKKYVLPYLYWNKMLKGEEV